MSETASLTVPASTSWLRLVRLLVAGSGATADLTVADLEDVRIAADELAAALIDGVDGGMLEVRCSPEPGTLRVECVVTGVGGAPELASIVEAVLRATTDEWAADLAASPRLGSFVRHRRGS